MLYFRILASSWKNCVAAIGVMCFLCAASAAHFLISGGRENEKIIYGNYYINFDFYRVHK